MRQIIKDYFCQNGIDEYVPGYTEMYILMITIALSVSPLIAMKRHLPAMKFFIASLVITIFAYFGGKVLFFIRTYDVASFSDLSGIFTTSGSESVGVYIGGSIGGILAMKLLRLDLLKSLDSYAPVIALCVFISRIGCFLNGCCYGKPTDLPWAVPGPLNFHESFISAATNINSMHEMVHPTQLYESIFGLLMFLVIIGFYKKINITGLIFFIYISAYSIFRFNVEYLRGDDRGVIWIFSLPQFFSIIIFFVGITGIFSLVRLHRKNLGKNTKNEALVYRLQELT